MRTAHTVQTCFSNSINWKCTGCLAESWKDLTQRKWSRTSYKFMQRKSITKSEILERERFEARREAVSPAEYLCLKCCTKKCVVANLKIPACPCFLLALENVFYCFIESEVFERVEKLFDISGQRSGSD